MPLKSYLMSQKIKVINRNKETGNIKPKWLKRFLERLARANRKYPGTGCRH